MQRLEVVGEAEVPIEERRDALQAERVVAADAHVLHAGDIGGANEDVHALVGPVEGRVRAPLRDGALVLRRLPDVVVVGLRRDQLQLVAVVPGPGRDELEPADVRDLLHVVERDVGAVDLRSSQVDQVLDDVDLLGRVAADAARA